MGENSVLPLPEFDRLRIQRSHHHRMKGRSFPTQAGEGCSYCICFAVGKCMCRGVSGANQLEAFPRPRRLQISLPTYLSCIQVSIHDVRIDRKNQAAVQVMLIHHQIQYGSEKCKPSARMVGFRHLSAGAPPELVGPNKQAPVLKKGARLAAYERTSSGTENP